MYTHTHTPYYIYKTHTHRIIYIYIPGIGIIPNAKFWWAVLYRMCSL
jgi:hypothetical protein